MTWENAERVQKNEAGQFRALIGGEWVPVTKAQKNEAGAFRVERAAKDYRALNKPVPVDPTEGMGGMEKFNAGAGKALTDIGQGAAQMVGMGPSAEEVRNRRELDKPLMATGAGTAGSVGMNIAALAPLAVVPGGATIAGAGALGALTGALQPTETGGERIANMGIGGALGSGVQTATYMPQMVRNAREAGRAIIEPLSAEGRDQIIGRALNKATGGQERDVIARLQNAQELVPGSLPTAGQAGGNAGIAAIERTATATNPTVMELSRQRMAAQNAARLGVLDDLSGTGGAREFVAANRDATAKQLYDQAYSMGVDLSKMSPARRGEITKLLQRPALQDALKEARTLASNEFVKLNDPAGSIKGLDYLKRALDDKIKGAVGNEQRVLVNLKDRLLTTIDTLSPEYAAARKVYQDMSRPINQMDIVQALRDRAVRPLDSQVMPSAYARALTDDTARSATGFNKATLETALEPSQLSSLNAIKDDLARAEFAKTAGRGVGSDTVQKLAMSNLLEATGAPRIPALLSRPAAIAKWATEKVYGAADKEAAKRLSEALLDPQETARIMAGVKPPPQSAIDEPTRRRLATLLRAGTLPAIPMIEGQ